MIIHQVTTKIKAKVLLIHIYVCLVRLVLELLHQYGVTHAIAYHKVVDLRNSGGKIVVTGEPEGVGGAVNGGWSEARENRERSTNDVEDGGGEGSTVVGGSVNWELIS